jgi:hypothetical protein
VELLHFWLSLQLQDEALDRPRPHDTASSSSPPSLQNTSNAQDSGGGGTQDWGGGMGGVGGGRGEWKRLASVVTWYCEAKWQVGGGLAPPPETSSLSVPRQEILKSPQYSESISKLYSGANFSEFASGPRT